MSREKGQPEKRGEPSDIEDKSMVSLPPSRRISMFRSRHDDKGEVSDEMRFDERAGSIWRCYAKRFLARVE